MLLPRQKHSIWKKHKQIVDSRLLEQFNSFDLMYIHGTITTAIINSFLSTFFALPIVIFIFISIIAISLNYFEIELPLIVYDLLSEDYVIMAGLIGYSVIAYPLILFLEIRNFYTARQKYERLRDQEDYITDWSELVEVEPGRWKRKKDLQQRAEHKAAVGDHVERGGEEGGQIEIDPNRYPDIEQFVAALPVYELTSRAEKYEARAASESDVSKRQYFQNLASAIRMRIAGMKD